MGNNLACQEDIREELIAGKAVLMSPRPTVNHNFITGSIYTIFSVYLKGKGCTPFADGTDLYLTEKDRFVPDGMIVCDRDMIKTDGVHGAPDLVIEVLCPSTARYDRGYKKEVYAKSGVQEYWIVSPGDKTVEQYLQEGGQLVLRDVYAVHPDCILEKMTEEERAAVQTDFKCTLFDDLTIQLEDIFARMI